MRTAPDLETLARYVLDRAVAAGADQAEAFVERTRTTAILRRGARNEAIATAETGIGLRVLAGGRPGFLATARTGMQALAAVAERAVARARRASPDEHATLPAASTALADTAVLALVDPALAAATTAEKIDILRREEAASRAAARLAHADFRYEDRVSEIHLASTRGVHVATTSAKAGISGRAVARADARAVASGRFTTRRFADFAVPHLGPELARRAAHIAHAEPAPPARLTVVLPPDLAADLLAALALALAAPNVARGASFLAGRLGKRIGNDLLNVIDDATLPGALGSAPADDEGTPTAYHHPIIGGRLAGWLADTQSAARLGTRSTGNAVRASFRTAPAVGPRNLILTPGHRAPAEIIAGIEHGLLIEQAERAAAFDPARGRYALRAAGRLIVHGRPGRPVTGIVTGLLPEMLVNLAALGHDLTFAGPIAAPTVAIAGMSVTPAA
jgi:PmbA protein